MIILIGVLVLIPGSNIQQDRIVSLGIRRVRLVGIARQMRLTGLCPVVIPHFAVFQCIEVLFTAAPLSRPGAFSFDRRGGVAATAPEFIIHGVKLRRFLAVTIRWIPRPERRPDATLAPLIPATSRCIRGFALFRRLGVRALVTIAFG